MIDIRYHIYSLAAIFLALALGVVIGTSFARSGPSQGNERRIIHSYEQSMQRLKQTLETTQESVVKSDQTAKDDEEFCRVVLPAVVKDMLPWRNVAVIQTGDYDDLTGSVKRALELAGAKVVGITDISRTFDFDNSKLVEQALAKCGVAVPDDTKKSREKLFGVISQAVCSDKFAYLRSALEELGVAKFTGDYTGVSHLKFAVIVGGASDDTTNGADAVDSALIAQLEKQGVTMVGCEGTSVASSYVPAWHKVGIATVDNSDSAMGQVAMICALNGEKAKFGTKETADRLIPQALEAK